LIHWQTSSLPPGLVSVEVEVPPVIERQEIDPADLSTSASGDFSVFRAIGDDWYDRSDTAVLWVPSLVSPYELNVLFNQRHDDFRRIVITMQYPSALTRAFGCEKNKLLLSPFIRIDFNSEESPNRVSKRFRGNVFFRSLQYSLALFEDECAGAESLWLSAISLAS